MFTVSRNWLALEGVPSRVSKAPDVKESKYKKDVNTVQNLNLAEKILGKFTYHLQSFSI